MSDIHVLSGVKNGYRLVFHFPVRNVNNSVGVNFRTALLNSGILPVDDAGLVVSVMAEGTEDGQISTAELGLLRSGEVLEVSVTIRAGDTAPSNTELDAFYNEELTKQRQRIERKLRYFGHTRNIP